MKFPIAILALATSTSLSDANGGPVLCMSGMQNALAEGHFTGPIVCSQSDATFVLAGHTAGQKFAIYDYRYKFRPSGGSATHGGQRLVVFQGGRYIGQYVLSPPPYAVLSVHGTNVVVETGTSRETVLLDFSGMPPKEVIIDGEVVVVFR